MPDRKKPKSLMPEVPHYNLAHLPDVPLQEEDAFTRFLAGLEEQLGAPVDSTGGGVAGLLGGAAGAVAAIPPKTAKELGRLMVGLMDEGNIKRAFEAAQQLYPRILGHVDQIEMTPGMGFFSNIGQQQRTIGTDKLSDIKIGEDALIHTLQGQADNTVGHELTHAAQQISGGRLFGPAYAKVNEITGYRNNPFEVSAREAGSNFQKKAKALRKSGPRSEPIEPPDMTRMPMAEFAPVTVGQPGELSPEAVAALAKLLGKNGKI